VYILKQSVMGFKVGLCSSWMLCSVTPQKTENLIYTMAKA